MYACGGEASGGEVAFVLDGIVAASWRHILRHDGRLWSWLNGYELAVAGMRRCEVEAA